MADQTNLRTEFKSSCTVGAGDGHLSTFDFLACRLLHDPAYFCENLDLYIFVLFSFIWTDGDLSS